METLVLQLPSAFQALRRSELRVMLESIRCASCLLRVCAIQGIPWLFLAGFA